MGISAKSLSELVREKEIYIRDPSLQHFRAAKKVMEDMLLRNWVEEMAVMKGFMSRLRRKGLTVEFYTNNGDEMKDIMVEAAELIFMQMKKTGNIRTDEKIDSGIVNVEDTEEDGVYYGRFMFIPSIAEDVFRLCRMTAAADAYNYHGLRLQSYGTILEVVVYDARHHVIPVLFITPLEQNVNNIGEGYLEC